MTHLADLPPMSAFDYLRSELTLWLAIMLVLLLSFATYTSSSRVGSDLAVFADVLEAD